MEFLIESTSQFETNFAQLTDKEKKLVIDNINNCIKRFSENKITVYNQLQQINDLSLKQNYESSLYVLEVADNLKVILTIDEDPIFSKTIFTLLQVVHPEDVKKVYQEVAAYLYQDLIATNQEIAQVS